MIILKRLLFLFSIYMLLFSFVSAISSGESNTTKGRTTRARRIFVGNIMFVVLFGVMIYWWEFHGRVVCRNKRQSQSPAAPSAIASNRDTDTTPNNQYEALALNEASATLNNEIQLDSQPPSQKKCIFLLQLRRPYLLLRPIALTIVFILSLISFWTNMFCCGREPTFLGVVSYGSFYLFLQLGLLLLYLVITHFVLRVSRLPKRSPKVPWNAVRLGPILLYLFLSTPLAFYYGTIGPRVVEVPLRFRTGSIPEQFDGYRVAQLSDIHLGPVVGYSRLQQIVELTNAIQPPPDIVVITGDLIDGPYNQLKDATIPLERFNKPTYFVAGNHEVYTDEMNEWLDLLRERRVHVLNNGAVALYARQAGNGSDAGPSLCLIGVGDVMADELEIVGHTMNFSLALAQCGSANTTQVVYLVHQPSAGRKSLALPGAERVRLVIAGHTHAGQIWPFSMFHHAVVRMGSRYFHGLYESLQHENQFVYVSPGTDCGFPFKLGAPKEITVFTFNVK